MKPAPAAPKNTVLTTFDAIRFDCPKCKLRLAVTRPGKDCYIFDANAVPYALASEVLGSDLVCPGCSTKCRVDLFVDNTKPITLALELTEVTR